MNSGGRRPANVAPKKIGHLGLAAPTAVEGPGHNFARPSTNRNDQDPEVLVLQGVIFNHRTVSAGHGRSRIVWRAELTAPRAGAIGSVLAGTPRRRRAPDNWAAKRCTRDSLDPGTAHRSDSTEANSLEYRVQPNAVRLT